MAPRPAEAGRQFHGRSEFLHRHVHHQPFFALVLGGSYVEAGDTGRQCVEAGDVIVHRPYEAHLDRFSGAGAEVLVLPLAGEWSGPAIAKVDDVDAIARMAEEDPDAASACLARTLIEKQLPAGDWPDMLARDLARDPDLSLSSWADRHRLHPASLARGFRQQFEVSPKSFRAIARTRRAVEGILSGNGSLSSIAVEEGFADQAHMSRAVRRLTGQSPDTLRRAGAGLLQS